jgi:hypothetical protein
VAVTCDLAVRIFHLLNFETNLAARRVRTFHGCLLPQSSGLYVGGKHL